MSNQSENFPYIPSGYITDGLVFFLDGKQLVTASAWTDIIGRKEFTLTNCSVGTNGVVFGSNSYGIYTGTITADAANETVEVVFLSTKATQTNQWFLSQPKIGNATGIQSGIAGKWTSSNEVSLTWHSDGSNHASYIFSNISQITLNELHCIGINGSRTIYDNAALTKNYSTNYGANSTGNTLIGARYNGSNMGTHFEGTLCALRIYNKKLTADQIKANQSIDVVRYAQS